MVNFSPEDIRAIMDKTHNIRNISVIGQCHNGKTTLCDSLVAAAGLISQEAAGDVRMLDNRADEAERGMTIKSTAISLRYDLSEDFLRGHEGQCCGNAFVCNLMDTPGHSDFSAEVSAALRITDGALVVVDCVEGVSVQTENLLRQALAERVKPVLVINKIDKCFKFDSEVVYYKICEIIEKVNSVIATYEHPAFRDLQICPMKGNVAFSAGTQGWAFTLKQLARFYASRSSDIEETVLLTKLWGDNYLDRGAKSWTRHNTGSATCSRGFVQLCYEPIKQMCDLCMAGPRAKENIWKALKRMGITINSEDKELTGKALLQRVMQTWLPASDALLEMMIFHLPSPCTAQKYRVNNLYEGPLDDVYANGIRNCDPEGPLVLYVSKVVPTSDNSRFFAFGRVFSGKVSTGLKVKIMGPEYVPGQKKDMHVKSVQGAVIWMGKKQERVDNVPCGNTVGLFGVDQFITKSATLATETEVDPYLIREMKFSVYPVVRVAVQCKQTADLPKLVEGLKRLRKSDPLVVCGIEESGEHTIAGAGELHLKICIKELKEIFMGGTEIIVSEPIVSYRETVRRRSSMTVMSRSPDKHSRLYMEALPLEGDVVSALDDGRFADVEECSRILAEEYGWDRDIANKVWCFSPQQIGPNMVVDRCRGAGQLHEVRESVVAGFQDAATEGALAGEKLRGVCFELRDVALHPDALRRGIMGQVTPTATRAMYAAQLSARPWLMEPILSVDIQAPVVAFGKISDLLVERRGAVQDMTIPRPDVYNIKATLPVAESFGFAEKLRVATSGEGVHQFAFLCWDLLGSDPLEQGSTAGSLVSKMRIRKGMSAQVSPVSYYEG